jgi:hypothetical protein
MYHKGDQGCKSIAPKQKNKPLKIKKIKKEKKKNQTFQKCELQMS